MSEGGWDFFFGGQCQPRFPRSTTHILKSMSPQRATYTVTHSQLRKHAMRGECVGAEMKWPSWAQTRRVFVFGESPCLRVQSTRQEGCMNKAWRRNTVMRQMKTPCNTTTASPLLRDAACRTIMLYSGCTSFGEVYQGVLRRQAFRWYIHQEFSMLLSRTLMTHIHLACSQAPSLVRWT